MNLGFSGPMLPIESLALAIRKAVKQDPKRATHGDTAKNAFYITESGDIIPWEGGYAKLKTPNRETASNASVHSHSVENWRHWQEITGAIEPFIPFSQGDFEIFQNQLGWGKLNTDVLIAADGRMNILYCPPESEARFTNMSPDRLKRLVTLPANWWKTQRWKGKQWYEVLAQRQRDFAKKAGLVLIEDARWRPPEEAVEPLVRPWREARYKEPERPPIQQILLREEAGRMLKPRERLTKPVWLKIPGEMWPLVAQQMELFRTSPRMLRRGTYTHVTPHAYVQYEPAQMRFFGFGARRRRHPADLDAAVKEALRKVEDRPLYIYATYYGLAVTKYPPPGTQNAIIVNPDKSIVSREYVGRGRMEEKELRAKEAQQMRFFGLGQAWKVAKTHEELETMDLRRDKYGFDAYIDWSNPQTVTENGEEVEAYPGYYRDGHALSKLLTRDEILRMSKSLTPTQLPLFGRDGFSGRFFHCLFWQVNPYSGDLRCSQYATACQAMESCAIGERGKIRACVRPKMVYSKHYRKQVQRCAQYAPVCGPGCITSPAPKPARVEEPSEKEIRAVAEWMAQEATAELPGYDPKMLAHEILSRGGIRAYRKQYPGQKTDEEYMALPLFLKRRTGLPPDELAAEMGFESDVDLYEAIHAAYPPKTAKTALQRKLERRKPTWREFEERAFRYLVTERRREAGLEGRR